MPSCNAPYLELNKGHLLFMFSFSVFPLIPR